MMTKKLDFQAAVAKLVKINLAFHNLNKTAEDKFGLSLVQYHLLNTLRDMPGCTPQRLAGALGMHPSTLTQSMKRLLKRTLIFVEEDPKDSRKKVIGLTPAGVVALDRLEKELDQFSHFEGAEGFLWSKVGVMKSLIGL